MRLLTSIYTLLFSSIALAASGGHGDDYIPIKELIIPQVFNVILVIGLLTFLTRKLIKEHFLGRKAQYHQHLEKAESARLSAEEKHKEIKERLIKLETTSSEQLEAAKAEAEELRHKIVSDAKSLSKKLEEEAVRSASFELDRAKAHLREELIESSMSLAGDGLKRAIDQKEIKRLQNEFVEKIQVVR